MGPAVVAGLTEPTKPPRRQAGARRQWHGPALRARCACPPARWPSELAPVGAVPCMWQQQLPVASQSGVLIKLRGAAPCQVVKCTSKLDAGEEQPRYVIEMPRMGKVRRSPWMGGDEGKLARGARGHPAEATSRLCAPVFEPFLSRQGRSPAACAGGTPACVRRLPCHPLQFVVGLGNRLAPADVEEGMRVGVDRQRLSIQLPLPTKLDSAVGMMQAGRAGRAAGAQSTEACGCGVGGGTIFRKPTPSLGWSWRLSRAPPLGVGWASWCWPCGSPACCRWRSGRA